MDAGGAEPARGIWLVGWGSWPAFPFDAGARVWATCGTAVGACGPLTNDNAHQPNAASTIVAPAMTARRIGHGRCGCGE